jgi:hypothetical protein
MATAASFPEALVKHFACTDSGAGFPGHGFVPGTEA